MGKRDILSSLFFIILGVGFLAGSFKFDIWGVYGPGPGFFPLLFGILLGLLSLFLLIDGIRRRYKWKNKKGTETDAQGFTNFHKIAAYLFCCVFVYFAMRPLGFLITIFLFLIVALPLAGQQSFRVSLMVAAIASLSVFLLFVELNVPLPLGPLQPLAALWRS